MDGKAEFLTPSGIGLGIDSGPLFEKNITEQSVSLNAGDIFLLYTDGIVEAMNHADEMFGEDYLLEILQRNHNSSAGAVKNEILTDLEEFLNGRMLQDDTTMVILKNSGNS
jgi:sigma-B regulation protein RsbU (phosphoserine phosphatase)